MKKLRKIIPVIAICIIGIMLTVIVKKSGHPLTVDTIIEYTPDNTLLAIVVRTDFIKTAGKRGRARGRLFEIPV